MAGTKVAGEVGRGRGVQGLVGNDKEFGFSSKHYEKLLKI